MVDPAKTNRIEPWARSTRSFKDQGSLRAFAFCPGEALAIVVDSQLKLVVLDRNPNIDTPGAAVANGIGHRLPQHLLNVELKPDRNRALLAAGADLAVDRPLLAQPLSQRLKLGDRIGQVKVRGRAEARSGSRGFRLLLD